jgi:hypothetical protein
MAFSVLGSLLGKTDDIEIILGAGTVMVCYKDRFERLKPVVYISPDETNPIVIAVGDSQAPTEPHVQIALFEPSVSLPKSVDKAVALEKFFAFILHNLLSLGVPRLLAGVRVTVKGIDSLDSVLCGYQKSLLKGAILKAGARECVFDT